MGSSIININISLNFDTFFSKIKSVDQCLGASILNKDRKVVVWEEDDYFIGNDCVLKRYFGYYFQEQWKQI